MQFALNGKDAVLFVEDFDAFYSQAKDMLNGMIETRYAGKTDLASYNNFFYPGFSEDGRTKTIGYLTDGLSLDESHPLIRGVKVEQVVSKSDKVKYIGENKVSFDIGVKTSFEHDKWDNDWEPDSSSGYSGTIDLFRNDTSSGLQLVKYTSQYLFTNLANYLTHEF